MKVSLSAGTPNVTLPQIMIKASLELIFEQASQIGVDGVDLFLKDTSEVSAATLTELSAAHGIDIVLVSAAAAAVEAGLSLVGPDPDTTAKFLGIAPKHLELAAAANAVVPVGFTRGRRTRHGVPVDDYDKRLLDALVRYDALAQSFGVQLAVEPINRYEIDSVPTVAAAAQLIRGGELKSTGILADIFHMNIEEVSIEGALRSCAGLLSHIHVSDSNRRPPGGGHLDLMSFVRTLRSIDYDGYLGIEAIPGDCAKSVLRSSIVYLRAVDEVVQSIPM